MNIGNDPLTYLKKYAHDNKMSVQDAMSALQSQYGTPSQIQSTSIFDMAGGPQKEGDPDFLGKMGKGPQMMPDAPNQENGFMQGIKDFIKGIGGGGPQKEGDPQIGKHLLPFRPGDNDNGRMEKLPGKFGDNDNGHMEKLPGKLDGYGKLSGLTGDGSKNQQSGINPDAFAQQYANQNGISLEEAKAQLKAKYGDPNRQQ